MTNKSGSCKSELDDDPFTEQDLQAIDAAFQAATSRKRRPTPPPPPPPPPDIPERTHHYHSDSPRRRLPNSIMALQHPNEFSLSPCRQANIKMTYPVMKFGGQIIYSRTSVEVEKASVKILKNIEARKKEAGQIAVGFDIEWRPTFKRGVPQRKAAVMQICGDSSCCHVMHIVHSGIPQSLQLLLEDSSIMKVGVGTGNDSVKVFKDYNVSTKAVEDLSYLANRKLGGLQNWGLASLTEKLICKQLLKPNKIRLGNWEAKFLSKEQLQYAATDAFTSWYLYEVLSSLPDAEKVTADSQIEELQVVSL